MIDTPENQEALHTLLRTLTLNEGFLLLPIRCDTYPQARALTEWLNAQGFLTTLLAPIEDDWDHLLTDLLQAPRGPGHALLLFARPSQRAAQLAALRGINQQRDPLIQQLDCPLLWCGPSSFHEQSWSCMPDMWSIRAVHLELVPPPPESLPTAQPTFNLFSWLQPEDIARDTALLAQAKGDPRAEARLTLRLVEGHLGQHNTAEAAALLDALRLDQLPAEDVQRVQLDRVYLAILTGEIEQARSLLEPLEPPQRYMPRTLYLWLCLAAEPTQPSSRYDQLVSSVEELPPADPGDIRELALALYHLSMSQASLGLHERALRNAEHGTHLYRQLAQERPLIFTPYLAGSLNNLGLRLSALGQREAALEAVEESVATYRTLSASRPEAFLPDLAGSLNNLGNMLSALGRCEEALAASRESVGYYTLLMRTYPEVFLRYFVMSVQGLLKHLQENDIDPESDPTLIEAITLLQSRAS